MDRPKGFPKKLASAANVIIVYCNNVKKLVVVICPAVVKSLYMMLVVADSVLDSLLESLICLWMCLQKKARRKANSVPPGWECFIID